MTEDDQPPARGRLAAFSGRVLEETLDDELQALVVEAARALEAPIALVSLVLDRIQFFRAFHGLPADLAVVRATSRDASFCQFVVRDDAPVVIDDAATDPALPQALVDEYGIRAYLGVPVHVGGEVLGSLCVIDTTPRRFDDRQRRHLRALADKVERRLAALAAGRARAPLGLIEAAVRPVFAELRNQLGPIRYSVEAARVAAFELHTHQTAIEMGADAAFLQRDLASVRRALGALREHLDEIDHATDQILDGVVTLERAASTRWDDQSLDAVVAEACALARHVTGAVGGARFTPPAAPLAVGLPLPIASAIIAAVLSWLAERMLSRRIAGPIALRARPGPGPATLTLTLTAPGLTTADIDAVERRFARLGMDATVRFHNVAPLLRLALPAEIEA
ncbi:MAG: GAF domain-containing protein [bacterium]